MKTAYTAIVTSHGGRKGHVTSNDKFIDLDVRPPKELGGAGGATNPEQLFAAGYAACFEGAMMHVASSQKYPLNHTSVQAEVMIGPREAGGFELGVKFTISGSGVEQDRLEHIVQEAHKNICPYSHATRNNIDVSFSVKAH